mmetsp:Transcript_4314/g.6808  ORF Transcript_4314/g.6808 Transcript_4314/m.6808 type:complete len:221 (-) Transcript_4314:244-906(-)
MTQDQTERQIIHRAVKCFGKFQSYYHRRVAIVALSHVQNPREAICKLGTQEFLTVNYAILSASKSKDQSIIRKIFGHISKVISIPLRTITSTNKNDSRQCTLLHSFDDLSGERKDNAMVETNGSVPCGFNRPGKSLHTQCLLNHGRKVSIATNVLNTTDSYFIHGVESFLVGPTWLLDAVGGDDDRPWEASKLELLILPGCSVITNQMRILLESGIGMGW